MASARSLVGLKEYVANLISALMNPQEVMAKYRDLWYVEQSFQTGLGGSRRWESNEQDRGDLNECHTRRLFELG